MRFWGRGARCRGGGGELYGGVVDAFGSLLAEAFGSFLRRCGGFVGS